jgi:predicted Rdx family selenoprotein
MIEGISVCAFYCLAVPWMLSTWLAQGLLSIATENMVQGSQEALNAALTAGRLLDEL